MSRNNLANTTIPSHVDVHNIQSATAAPSHHPQNASSLTVHYHCISLSPYNTQEYAEEEEEEMQSSSNLDFSGILAALRRNNFSHEPYSMEVIYV